MDLEKRVQQLEEELEILKNQIQTTLLDIQEQLLTNAYPSLRSENQSMMPAPVPAPAAPVSTYVPPQPEPASDPVEAAPVKVRKVRLDDLAPKPPTPSPAQYEPVEDEADYVDMEEYKRWAIRNIKEIGLKETRNLIRNYAREGLLLPEVRDELLQVTAQYAAAHKSPKPVRQQPAPRQQRPAPRAEAATVQRSQPVQMNTAAYPAYDDRTQPSRQAVVAPEQPKRQEPAEHEESSSNLILRLMAGVQNAGAGVKWSKKNNG